MLVLMWFYFTLVIKVRGFNLKSSVTLNNGGYSDIVVAIDESLQENMDLITAIQNMFIDGSAFLYQATRKRVHFKNVTIIIPSHWPKEPEYGPPGRLNFQTADVIIAQPNPLWAPEPYTQQVLGCGQPGSFIHFTEDFLTDSGVENTYGDYGRILVHEWGHYRWGLFNEYPDAIGDAGHMTHYYQSTEDSKWKPVTCSQEYQTSPTRLVERNGGILFGDCSGNEIQGYQAGCIVRITGAGGATGSIMNGPLTIHEIVNFCDNNETDPGNLHNYEAPNKHNRLCSSRSAWEVMRDHEDFKDGNSPPSDLNGVQTEPIFNMVQAGTGCRVVLVLDTSGSMGTNNRIDKVNSAATAFINLLDDGIWVGIVTFTSNPVTRHNLTQADRDSLRGVISFTARGGTCIGCGLEKGLEVLRQHPSGIAGGGVLLLMTDGRDSGIDNHPVRRTLQDEGVRVNTVAIGEDAFAELNEIADETGGTAIFYPDNGLSNIDSALSQSLSMCTAMRIQLVGEGFSLDSGETKSGCLYLDPLVGNDTQFVVTYTESSSSSAPGVNVVITEPDNATITSNNLLYDADTTRRVITISINGQAKSGKWQYSIENSVSGLQSATLSVYSRSILGQAEEEPIAMSSSLGNAILDLSSELAPLSAFAQLKQGFRPVFNAIIHAIIERPGGYPAETIQLLDDGAGADTTANDGIYSRYFTNITGTGFYGIHVVSENDGSAIILTRARTGISRVQASIRVSDDGQILSDGNVGAYEVRYPGIDPDQTLQGEPAPLFTRSSSTGSTRITNVPVGFMPGQDMFPPNRIQDLQVLMTHVENLTLVLSWTAPGDDLDAGTATSYDIRTSNSSRQLLTEFNNTARVTSPSILVGNLASPQPFGSVETFTIAVPDMPGVNSFSYGFAIRATDDEGKTSPMSNVAVATFRRVIPTAPPSGPCMGMVCLNGGGLVEPNCTCSCTNDFQGNICQHSKVQLRNGVLIHFQANISQCEQLLTPLTNETADQLNAFCLSNFAECCSNASPVNGPRGQFVETNYVRIADGYPTAPELLQGCYVVIYALQPNEPDLCTASGLNKRRKRDINELHRVRRQLQDQTEYVPQSILLAAISSGESAIEVAVDTDILSITLPRVDGDPVMKTPATVPPYLIGVIVTVAVFFIAILMCLFCSYARVSVRREAQKERHDIRHQEFNYGPRFMQDGPPPSREVNSISGDVFGLHNVRFNHGHGPRQQSGQRPLRGDHDMYAEVSYPHGPAHVYPHPDDRFIRGERYFY